MKFPIIILVYLIMAQTTFAQTYQQLTDSTQHYTEKADYNTALLWAEKTLQQAEKEFGKKDTHYASTLLSLVELCYYVSNSEKGIAYAKENIEIRKEIQGETNLDYAASLNALAVIYQDISKYAEAEYLYLISNEIIKAQLGENHPDYANSLSNLADIYNTMGRYPEAEELFLKSINIYPDNATSINNLATLYEKIGRYPQAIELFLRSNDIIIKTLGKDHLDYAASLGNLASLYRTMKSYPEAEELSLKAIEIEKVQLGETHPAFSTSLNNLAYLYLKMGRYSEAEELFLKAISIRKEIQGELHPFYANFLINLAGLYETLGRYTEAEELNLKALNIRKTILNENHPDLADDIYILAGLYEEVGDYKEANYYFQQALHKYIYLIHAYFPGMSEKEQKQFFNKKIKRKFEHYYSFALSTFKGETGDNEWQKPIPSSMLNYRFATKGLLFNSSNKMRENILTSGDTTLVQLFRTWKSKRDYLAKLFTLSKTEIEKQGVSIEGIQKEINDMEKEVSKKSVFFDKESGKEEAKWQDVQAQLKDDEAFVEIIRFRKYGTLTDTVHYKDSSWYVKKDGFTDTVHYAALILKSKENPKLVILENGNDLEEMYYGGYKLAIKHFQTYKEGYTQYWGKIAQELQGIKTVYFSADGVYNQINLNTLQNPQTDKYLLEEMDMHLVTSSKDLLKSQKLKVKSQNLEFLTASLYGYVNYENNIASEDLGELPVLPGTQKEVVTIEALLKEKKWTTNMYQWNQSSEGSVKREKSPTVLHIATHGYFLTNSKIRGRKILGIDSIYYSLNPLLKSGLLLAADTTVSEKETQIKEMGLGLYGKEQDGILTAYEAMNLNLDNTELVVLSACETGLGNQIHGEGIFGLQRAFQQAGAKAVIMSLWAVSDQHTQELMTLFYTKWLSGVNKKEAFKQTQAEMKTKYVHPYYWGAFVMVGN